MSESGDDVSLRWNAVCIDCRDANELADFYAELLGWPITTRDGDWIHLADPSGGVALNIQGEAWYEPPVWPEEPTAPSKMMHFEIRVDDVERAVRHAERLGAQQAAWQPPGREASTLRVMLDPAGHPFCLWTT